MVTRLTLLLVKIKEKKLLKIQPLPKALRVQAIRSKQIRNIYNCYIHACYCNERASLRRIFRTPQCLLGALIYRYYGFVSVCDNPKHKRVQSLCCLLITGLEQAKVKRLARRRSKSFSSKVMVLASKVHRFRAVCLKQRPNALSHIEQAAGIHAMPECRY
jgi:hypothetical protein